MKYNTDNIILNTNLAPLTFSEVVASIEKWIDKRESKYVCVCNTHSLVTAYRNPSFKDVLANASICTHDGMPLVFATRLNGFKNQDRVDGPNLMLALSHLASQKQYRVMLFGNTNENLDRLEQNLKKKYSNLNIVGKLSPPFRKLSSKEEKEIEKSIHNKKPQLLFVSLGCPKQEKWMYSHRNSFSGTTMVGVGAAFDYINGDIKRPPIFFQKIGLEWFFRLLTEPKRLFKRYLVNNLLYIFYYLRTFGKNKKNIKKSLNGAPNE